MNKTVLQERPQRLDRWLWCARFFKTRTLAAQFVDDGNVRVTRRGRTVRARKAHFAVGCGDMLAFSRNGRVRVVKVLSSAERRGPPSQAQTLYADESPPPAPNAPHEAGSFRRERGAGRPTKKDRRATDAFKMR
jgi:ribosome-associated heat shock protein Hsp15